jgi:hypothetical protein
VRRNITAGLDEINLPTYRWYTRDIQVYGTSGFHFGRVLSLFRSLISAYSLEDLLDNDQLPPVMWIEQ